MKRKILIGIGVVIIGLQFFRGEEPEVKMDNPNDMLVAQQVSGEISGIMKSACYDCHSNETSYPWYTYITPLSWWIFDHIEEGREELNFSEWTVMEKRRKIRKLKEIGEEVEEGEMPLKSYTLIHGESRLSDEQKQVLIEWAEEMAGQVMKE